MNRKRILRTLCVVVMLLLSFSACDESEVSPISSDPATASTTAKPTTVRTTTTTVPTTTTTRAHPVPPDPDPVMTFEEYIADGWYGYENRTGELTDSMVFPGSIGFRNYGSEHGFSCGVHRGDYFLPYKGGMDLYPEKTASIKEWLSTLNEGSLYCLTLSYGKQAIELQSDFTYYNNQTNICEHLGYFYVALDNTIYRYRYDGVEETVIYTTDSRIYGLSADRYAVYFLTENGLHRLFRPTGQVDLLTTEMKVNESYDRFYRSSPDIVMYGIVMEPEARVYYSITQDRLFTEEEWSRICAEYKELTGVEDFSPTLPEFRTWFAEYCENNPE